MRIVRHANAGSLLECAQPWLERAEAENNMILGICAQLAGPSDESESESLFLTLEVGKAVAGVAVMTPPRKLVTSNWAADKMTVLTDFLADSQISVPGVFGPAPEAEALAREWRRRSNVCCRLVMRQTLYECRVANRIHRTAGRFRRATADDVPLLSQWHRAFVAEIGIDEPPESGDQAIERGIAAGNMFVWQDGPVVSAAAVGRESRCGAAVTFVYTPPESRGRGYATSCVSALTHTIFARGKTFASLFADSANMTSSRVYQRIGYRHLRDFQLWAFS